MDESDPNRNIFRWLKPLLKTGFERELNEDDVYAVSDCMQSAQNTDAFEKQWQIELEKPNPSFIRVILKIYGFEAIVVPLLYAIASTAVR